MTKVTQKQMAFFRLYHERRVDPEKFLPTWEFVGELYINEFDQWVLMSYKCPTRLSDLYKENPTLLERSLITGKSGAHYYGYRLRVGVSPADIKDDSIREFYKELKAKEV